MSALPGLLASPPPSVGVEIASDRVTAVNVTKQAGGWVVASHATEALPKGAVIPSMNAANIADTGIVAGALRSAFEKMGTRARRVALVIPDTAAKLSLLRFEKVPAAEDLDQLIRWQVRKAAPFKPEDAQISWVPAAALPGGGREFLVTMARRDIVESYMRVCESAGAEAGVVDLASLNLINAALASGGDAPGDWLVVHVAPDYATLAIVRNKDLIFFRTRQTESDADLTDLIHQTAMYHQDRLGGGQFGRVILSGGSRSAATKPLALEIAERIGARVEALDFRGTASIRDRISAGPELLDVLAPAVGVLLRERVA